MELEPELLSYLEKLLGEKVPLNQRIALSSTQRAQLFAWLNSKGVAADFNKFKSNLISIPELLGSAPVQEAELLATAPRSAAPILLAAVPAGFGVGIDLQSCANLPEADDYRSHKFYAANFTDREIAHCIQQADPRESLCGIWAAKEAVVKSGASAASAKGEYRHVEISRSADGVPSFPGCAVSISHDAGFAVAICIKLG